MTPHPLQPPDVFEPEAQGVDRADLRKLNERAVLTIVALNPGVSGAEISRRSGLSPQSVSAMLTGFEQQSLVTRKSVIRGKRGQPATPFELNKKGAFGIGCELGWRHIEIRLVDLGLSNLGHYSRHYPYPDAHTLITEAADAINSMTKVLSESEGKRIAGLGVAIPGTFSRNIGLLAPPADQAALWARLDVGAELAQATGLPVNVFNDGNAGCWSELASLPKPRPSDLVFVQVSTFVSAGVFAEGALWEGSTGNAANLGSMLVPDTTGAMRPAHTFASLYALDQLLLERGMSPPVGDPSLWDWTALEPVATEWLDHAAGAIALVLTNTRAMTEFKTAVVDGLMPAPVIARLVGKVQAVLAAGPDNTFDSPTVLQGTRGRSAPSLGAAMLPIYRKLFSRTLEDIMATATP